MARAVTKNVLVRFPPKTHATVKAATASVGVSFNSFVTSAASYVATLVGATSGTPPTVAGDAAIAAVLHSEDVRSREGES
jgi:hypothetical protein